jgi:hypothetical protein
MDKPILLDEIRTSHALWASTADGFSDEALLEPVMGEWTRKDLVAHVEYWERHSADVIEALRGGRDLYDGRPQPSTDEQNERAWLDSREVPAAEVRQRERDAWERLLRVLEDAEEHELFDPGRYPAMEGQALAEMVREDTTAHYAEHLPHLTSGSGP